MCLRDHPCLTDQSCFLPLFGVKLVARSEDLYTDLDSKIVRKVENVHHRRNVGDRIAYAPITSLHPFVFTM